ncbi:MAG: TMEM165/GDT1 family protein [Anaerolineae bacterium]|nr:TMEM165/GDT1 family protein [Anaerolineae bacterium]
MNWGSFLSTFGLVFVAELGDKTQLAVITQTCRYRRPFPVFVGGASSLVLVTALGVVGGQVLRTFVPQDVIRIVAALAFVVMGVLIWREATRTGVKVANGEELGCEVSSLASQDGLWDWRAFSSTATLLFFAELGDKTQLAVMGLACRRLAPWVIFAGGALALVLVTAIGVVGGYHLRRWLPERLLLKASSVLFLVMGGLMGAGVF